MLKKFMLGSAMSIMLFGGSVFADNGHGTHVAGTIGAVSNNGTAIGGNGRDVLLGGAGTDYLSVVVYLMVAGVQYLTVR
jgi:subtilisin family serine protease